AARAIPGRTRPHLPIGTRRSGSGIVGGTPANRCLARGSEASDRLVERTAAGGPRRGVVWFPKRTGALTAAFGAAHGLGHDSQLDHAALLLLLQVRASFLHVHVVPGQAFAHRPLSAAVK